jgi:hypothetical protein
MTSKPMEGLSVTTPKPLYRKIKLTQGQVALVDACDYEELLKHKWYAGWNVHTHSFYAVRNSVKADGAPRRTIYMAREILGLRGRWQQGDHAMRNTLDNRRSVRGKENLRLATPGQNRHNCKVLSSNSTGYTGVQLCRNGLYRARIYIGERVRYLGTRKTARAASKLYTAAAREHHGKFARVP